VDFCKINNCTYEIIDIKDNELIMDKGCKEKIELNVINFDDNNKVAKPFSYMELIEMAKKDSTIAIESFERKIGKLIKWFVKYLRITLKFRSRILKKFLRLKN